MLVRSGYKLWRIGDIKTLTATNTDYILYTLAINVSSGNYNSLIDSISTSSSIPTTPAENLIDGDDSTFVRSYANVYLKWYVTFGILELDWITSITLKGDIGGREIQSFQLEYYDYSIDKWVLYEVLNPNIESGFSDTFTVNTTNKYEIDIGVSDYDTYDYPIISPVRYEYKTSSINSYTISPINTVRLDRDNFTDIDKRVIKGMLLYNTSFTSVHLYEKPTKKLKETKIVDVYGRYEFDKLTKGKSYYVVDNNYNKIYDTDYEGKETIKGFVEGVTEPVKVTLVDKYGNELEQQLTTNFEFLNYNTTNLNGSIKVGDTLTPVEYYIGQTRGYISASVVITECLDSYFVIHCFRSSDKQFIGEYPIIDDRYTIDNLNLTQTYDIMLHDKNKVVETQVHSRRTPSIYQ